jgi:hypothetical protein
MFLITCQFIANNPLRTAKESCFSFDDGIEELTIGLYAGDVTMGDVQDIPRLLR